MAKERRRNQCKDHVPVQLVIWFVGIMGILSLLAGVWLDFAGKSSAGVLAITLGCVTGLLALLAKTGGEQPQQQPVASTVYSETRTLETPAEPADGKEEKAESQ